MKSDNLRLWPTSSTGRPLKYCYPARLLPALAALILSLPSAAAPISSATPEDNNGLAVTLGALGGSHVAATLTALVPSPIAPAASRAEAAINAGLKTVPPVLEVSDDIDVYPNTPVNGYECLYTYNLPRTTDRYKNDLTYFTTDGIEEDWGPLDQPLVLHANSPVELRLFGLPEGLQSLGPDRHPLTWEAATQFSPTVDILIPAAFDIVSTYMRYATKTRRIAKVKPKLTRRSGACA